MVKIFSDAAGLDSIREAASNPVIAGVTTNPSLLRKAGVSNYREFVREAAQILDGKPLSVEVISDEPNGIFNEALELNSWASGMFIKVPIALPSGREVVDTIAKLAENGVLLNVTAVFTDEQIRESFEATSSTPGHIVSIFAGRIADTLRDPAESFAFATALRSESFSHSSPELLWASTRQIFDLIAAEKSGADIITIPPELLSKLSVRGKDLHEFSVETVEMFIRDAAASSLKIL